MSHMLCMSCPKEDKTSLLWLFFQIHNLNLTMKKRQTNTNSGDTPPRPGEKG